MKLTKNFSKSEFDSKDGSEMPTSVLYNIRILAEQLQVIRDTIGKPIKISSGYRSEAHNRDIGGVVNSRHVKGQAADLQVEGLSPFELHMIIENLIDKGKIKEGGLGLYNNFVHYDIRGFKARWDYSK